MKSLSSYIQQRYYFIVLFAILLPLTLSLVLILSINLTFWYDNTRDLLSAWDNLSKFTLIGPPSGIPGIFYGPYWIWLLSIGLFFSKNPLIVTIITATIPYFILFPLIWFRFTKFFDRTSVVIGWLLFIFSSGMTYATQLWNLYPAPLISLIVIYLLILAKFTEITKRQTLIAATIGFLIGLLINFHISFGLAFLTGTIIFFIADVLVTFFLNAEKSKRIFWVKRIYSVIFIFLGLFISFLPALIFEARHGFHQTQILAHTLFKFGAVVTVTGMNKTQILQTFLKSFGNLLQMPVLPAGIVLVILIITLIYFTFKHKIIYKKKDARIFLLLSSLFAGNLFIYLTAKNPVWEYHFIGVDILFLLMLTFFTSRFSLFRKGLILYTIIIICVNVATFIIYFHNHTSHFEQQEDVVKIISNDAKNTDYTVYAYNSSIYTYDFSYLFRWTAHKNVPYDPGIIKHSSNTIYLIIPMNNDAKVQDFIHFRSQPDKYKKVKMWKTENSFVVLKYVTRGER